MPISSLKLLVSSYSSWTGTGSSRENVCLEGSGVEGWEIDGGRGSLEICVWMGGGMITIWWWMIGLGIICWRVARGEWGVRICINVGVIQWCDIWKQWWIGGGDV